MSNYLSTLKKLAGVVILAGGASRRMGTPKAELTLPTDETLLDYHVRQSLKLNVPIMIADNGRHFSVDAQLLANNPKITITHIADYRSEFIIDDDKSDATQGPLVAIESALQSLVNAPDINRLEDKQSWLLVISCDSLINAYDIWKQMKPYIESNIDDIKGKSVICLTDEDHLYPLLGLYRLNIESDLRAYIDSGERKVMTFIEPRVQSIPVIKKQQLLTNFNTPEDFERACAALYDL